MIPISGYEGKRVGVLGLARSGQATARALRAGGAIPVCWDDTETVRNVVAGEGFEVSDLNQAANWDGIVLLVVSPGIPHLYPAPHAAIECAWSAGIPVDNDIGLFMSAIGDSASPASKIESLVCVTGSNGKSTTTALIAHLLNGAGRPAIAVGNIGMPVLELEMTEGLNVVLELSSYQLDAARTLRPDIAVLLNISPDHLDRHGGVGGYFAAKRRLMDAVLPEAMIIGVDENEGRFLASQLQSTQRTDNRVTRLSTVSGDRTAGRMIRAEGDQLKETVDGVTTANVDLRDAPNLRGRHNWQNAAAAFGACRALGLTADEIASHFASFAGLAHRMEEIAVIDGVRFVNDSKATNADAADKALGSYPAPIYWIAGGRAKEGGLTGLEGHFSKIAKAYLIGEAAESFADALGSSVPHVQSGTLDVALSSAADDAFAAGDSDATVLLSPACASFDQFDSFEARGEAFRHAVLSARQQRGAAA